MNTRVGSRSFLWGVRLIILLGFFSISCKGNLEHLLDRNQDIHRAGITPDIFKKNDFSIGYGDTTSNKYTLRYLGTGGYYIGNDSAAILIDPFFSHQKMTRVLFKIRSKPTSIHNGLDPFRDDLEEKVIGVFAAHSHYDHIMDIPYVYTHFLDTSDDSLKIYGSKSTKAILSTVIDPDRLNNIESKMSNPKEPGEWIKFPEYGIKVLPIETNHAPHFKSWWLRIKFFSGHSRPQSNYTSPYQKTWGSKWKEGQTFAFLVDFYEGDDIHFRVFIQTSASKKRGGFINDEHSKKRNVDLAILGAASFHTVPDYPTSLVKHLKPKDILIAHWEDFFVPYDQETIATVRGTDLGEFLLKLNADYPWVLNGQQRVFVPQPGVEIKLYAN